MNIPVVEIRRTRARSLLVGLPGLLALIACGAPPAPEAQAPIPAAPPATPPPSAAVPAPSGTNQAVENRAASVIAKGFTALPTQAQVLATSPERRSDPFAPLPTPTPSPSAASPAPGASGGPGSAGAATAAPMGLPPGFRFHGVVSVAGVPQALVAFGNESGTVSIGDRGGGSLPMLPSGWSVAAIDAGSGRLQLRQGKQLVTTRLSSGLP